MTTADIADELRSRGYRATRPRIAVWAVLAGADRHLTAEEVAERVRGREAGVNLASVYRALALFDELGLARESRFAGEAGRWEVAHPDEHFHLVCEACGAVDHHGGDLVERVREHLRDGHGFRPRTVELLVSGRCSACAD